MKKISLGIMLLLSTSIVLGSITPIWMYQEDATSFQYPDIIEGIKYILNDGLYTDCIMDMQGEYYETYDVPKFATPKSVLTVGFVDWQSWQIVNISLEPCFNRREINVRVRGEMIYNPDSDRYEQSYYYECYNKEWIMLIQSDNFQSCYAEMGVWWNLRK